MDDCWHCSFLARLGPADRADVLSEQRPGASAFLEAVPNEKLGLLFEPEEFLTELKRRLLVPVYEAGHYCLCAGAGDRVHRHNAVRNAVGRFAAAAGMNPEVESQGLLPPRPEDTRHDPSRRRPADVYIPSWHHGTPAAFDFAVSSPHCQAARVLAAQGMGRAAREYAGVQRA